MPEHSLMARWDGQEPDDVCKIAITAEYLEGRAAAERGESDYIAASVYITDYYRRMDFYIGFHDFKDGVSVEQRQAAEALGETWAA